MRASEPFSSAGSAIFQCGLDDQPSTVSWVGLNHRSSNRLCVRTVGSFGGERTAACVRVEISRRRARTVFGGTSSLPTVCARLEGGACGRVSGRDDGACACVCARALGLWRDVWSTACVRACLCACADAHGVSSRARMRRARARGCACACWTGGRQLASTRLPQPQTLNPKP